MRQFSEYSLVYLHLSQNTFLLLFRSKTGLPIFKKSNKYLKNFDLKCSFGDYSLIISETNKEKYTEIFPPLLIKPPYMYMLMYIQCREPKRSEKKSNFKEDDRALLLYRTYYSMLLPVSWLDWLLTSSTTTRPGPSLS